VFGGVFGGGFGGVVWGDGTLVIVKVRHERLL
jgi:hypothetical protein